MTLDDVQAMTTIDDKPTIASGGRETNGPRFPKFNAAMTEARRLSPGAPIEQGATSVLPAEEPAHKDKRTVLFSVGLLGTGVAAFSVVALVHFLAASPEAVRPASAAQQLSVPLPAIAAFEVDESDDAKQGAMRRERETSRAGTGVDSTGVLASIEPEPIALAPSSFAPARSSFVGAPPPPIDLRAVAVPSHRDHEAKPTSGASHAKFGLSTATVDKARISRGPGVAADAGASSVRVATPTVPDYRIQLAALSVETTAHEMWTDLVAEHGAVLSALAPTVERKGVLYLLRAGPFTTLDGARSACTRLRHEGADCILASR